MSIDGFGRMIHTLCSVFSVSVSVFATRFGCHHKIRNCNNVYAALMVRPLLKKRFLISESFYLVK